MFIRFKVKFLLCYFGSFKAMYECVFRQRLLPADHGYAYQHSDVRDGSLVSYSTLTICNLYSRTSWGSGVPVALGLLLIFQFFPLIFLRGLPPRPCACTDARVPLAFLLGFPPTFVFGLTRPGCGFIFSLWHTQGKDPSHCRSLTAEAPREFVTFVRLMVH